MADIRSYFDKPSGSSGTKAGAAPKTSKGTSSSTANGASGSSGNASKRKAIEIDDDDQPVQSTHFDRSKKKANTVISSDLDEPDDKPIAKKPHSSTSSTAKPTTTVSSKSTKKPPAKKSQAPQRISLSSDEDDDEIIVTKTSNSASSKPAKPISSTVKTATTGTKSNKPDEGKRKSRDDEDDEDDGQEEKKVEEKKKSGRPSPAKKSKTVESKVTASKKGSGKKSAGRKSNDLDDFIADDDEEDEDEDLYMDDKDDEEEEIIKPSKKASSSSKPPAKPRASASSASKSKSKAKDEDEAGGNAKAKAPAKGKGKAKEDDDGEDTKLKPKPKWIPKVREGPANPGSKEIPEGEPDCLAGLTIVFTGELDSIGRDEGQNLVKRYGGRVTTSVSSKTSYVVLGNDAGAKKLEMIKKHKVKTLDEDAFLELISKRPGGAADPKYAEKQKKEEEKIVQAAKEMAPKKGDVDTSHQLWTVKYAPTAIKDICGNKGQVEKLQKWLQNWPKNLKANFKKPGPDGMGVQKAVLITGPPGIGKTTAAHLVAHLEGFTVIELNASDTRSKKLLEMAYKETVGNTSLDGFFKDELAKKEHTSDKTVLIMDEVDGMSAGDRGGIGAVNQLIKKTKIPIICIANERSIPKMKPLMFTTANLAFRRPEASMIRSRMLSIAFREGMKIPGNVIDQLVAGSQSDIRQIVNMLSTWKLNSDTIDFDQGKALSKMNEKNTIQTPWSVLSKLFSPQAFSPTNPTTMNERIEMYFTDHGMMPLFVQENYLKHNFSRASSIADPKEKSMKRMELVSKAADAISESDLVDRMIHGTQQHWSLMPVHGVFSCVRPSYWCHGAGSFGGGGYGAGGGSGGSQSFPAWFGKNSTQTKLKRLLGEVQIRMRLKVSGDRKEIRENYLPVLLPKLVKPLLENGVEGVDEVIALMDDYYLTKEEWEAILELGIGENSGEDLLQSIPTAVKTAFTRNYNKGSHPIPFYKASEIGVKPAKKISSDEVPDNEEAIEMDDEPEEDETAEDGKEDDDEGESALVKDKLIKAKKPKGSGAKAAGASKAKAGAEPKKPRASGSGARGGRGGKAKAGSSKK